LGTFPASARTAEQIRIPPGVDPTHLMLGDWWKEEDLPLDWGRLLPAGPLRVEVGYGGGEFLLEMARLDPASNFVGIERFGEGHRRLLKALGESGVRNVLSMVGDAYILLNLTFAEGSLASVTVNFSDPWPKTRHERNRLLREEFLRIVARKLVPGGILYAATDDVPYAHQAAEALAAVPSLRSEHPAEPWLSESPHPVRTRYERRWMAEGRPLHYFLFRKEGPPCPT
jgi:tRNA (guanine-N7-)-methyltransferase